MSLINYCVADLLMMQSTTSTLDQTMMTDYWTKNVPADSVYREELKLY